MKVIIFGYGEMGKSLVKQYLNYECDFKIVAVTDNKVFGESIDGIPFIKPSEINKIEFDEIWITTAWYLEIKNQLVNEMGIDEGKIEFTEPVLPIIEKRIREKYRDVDRSTLGAEYQDALKYMDSKHMRMYNSPLYDEYLSKDTPIYFDEDKGLFYGIYEGKKMYLSRKINALQKARKYYNGVVMEQEKSCPHCYWNFDGFKNISGNVIDIGAAEGVFGLKIIDQVDHLYMIEADEGWKEALEYTYEAYKDKITIISKYASDIIDENSITLDSTFSGIKVDAIKADIEGMELKALKGAEAVLKNNDIRLGICVYHNNDDNELTQEYLKSLGYQCSNSNGLLVCYGDWELDNLDIDFRQALVFAEKTK